VGGQFGGRANIWVRAEAEPFLQRWEASLRAKRAKRMQPHPSKEAGIYG
jgi:hypothetical protein